MQALLLTVAVSYLLVFFSALAISEREGDVPLVVDAPGDITVLAENSRRVRVILPPGLHSFRIRMSPGSGSDASQALVVDRDAIDVLSVTPQPSGRAMTDYFYEPSRSDSGSHGSAHLFPFDLPVNAGAVVLAVDVESKFGASLMLRVMPERDARMLDARLLLWDAVSYGALVALIVLLLALHLSTGEPVSLAFVWYAFLLLVSQLLYHGRLYLVPGLEWLALAGASAMAGLRTMLVVSAIPMMLWLGQVGAPPVRLHQKVLWANCVLVLLAVMQTLGWFPAVLARVQEWAWLVGFLLIIGLNIRAVRARRPLAGLILVTMLLTVLLVVVGDLNRLGVIARGSWAMPAGQFAAVAWTMLVGLGLIRRVEAYRAELEIARDAQRSLLRSAETDGLTGLLNRAALDKRLDAILAAGPGRGSPLAVMFIDIDHFKAINDRFGHAVGDDVLRIVTAKLETAMREGDVLGRYGGEEFVVLARGLDQSTACELAERLRLAIGSAVVESGGERIMLTASVGVAARRDGDVDVDALVARADAAMYAAKRAGRNRVVMSGDDADVMPAQAS